MEVSFTIVFNITLKLQASLKFRLIYSLPRSSEETGFIVAEMKPMSVRCFLVISKGKLKSIIHKCEILKIICWITATADIQLIIPKKD
jgi:hypothetical protein